MWLRPQGYAAITSPDEGMADLDGLQRVKTKQGTNEYDTLVCGHCNRIVHVPAKCDPAALGGLCKSCMKLICPRCVGEGCTPLEKQIEAMEERDYLRRSYFG